MISKGRILKPFVEDPMTTSKKPAAKKPTKVKSRATVQKIAPVGINLKTRKPRIKTPPMDQP